MSSPTELYLPPSLPYPIRLVSLAARTNADVHRGTRLLDYSFTHKTPDAPPELRFGTWDASIEGTLSKWNFAQGDTISERRARETPAVLIVEPCKHGVQIGGLCCLCGKDMTSFDYTGFSDASRASIQMTHLANGPLVSLEEAQRIEQETAQHLFSSRKLSLIVDLDQTIVHATVDPTVGEWIAEGEAWEAREAKKAAQAEEGEKKDGADATDEVNPNWEALKDVKKFRLGPEALGQPQRGKGRGKEKLIEQEGCMYYIKPRPGLPEFLQTMATKYEMHVYTMGTRAYAEEVCAAIDPGGKIFGNRILSRDESGSLTQKSLQRLFPCDQSMVVIIDDRADVWEWSPNLVKVIPYDFFVGIGDINSAFLPKLEPLTPVTTPPPPVTAVETSPEGGEASAADADVDADDDEEDEDDLDDVLESTDGQSSQVEENSLTEIQKNEILTRNTEALEAQVEERPLAKKQEELQETAAEDAAAASAVADAQPAAEAAPAANGATSQLAAEAVVKERPVRRALLHNNDSELARVKQILELVHDRFYTAWEKYQSEDETKNAKRKHGKRTEAQREHDVRTIIPRIRTETLDGCHILFSSVIPLDTRPEATEIWKTAHAFGAKCYTELNPRITHVVAAKRGTQKVDAARRRGGIKIVWLAWFTDSVALWQHQPETPYLLDPEPRPDAGGGGGGDARLASPPSDPQQISSDPEPDADDWDELGAGGGSGSGSRAIGALGVEGGAGGKGEKGAGGAGTNEEGLALDEVDWDEINNEVEAAMNESDDDGEGGSVKSGFSEDEFTDESNSVISSTTSTPRKKRKRLRSITPSEVGSLNGADRDVLRSPLAKRKKLAADRSGASRLKEAFTADELARPDPDDDDASAAQSRRSSPVNGSGGEAGDYGEDYEGSDDEMDDEDDFLARELEEEWG